jgi:hypothetical protein
VGPGPSEQENPPVLPNQLAPESQPAESAAKDLSALLAPGGETTLVAVPVDPYVVHCQWEVARADLENAQRALGVGAEEFWPALHFYDVTDAVRNEAPPWLSFAVDVQLEAGNWFVRSCNPDRTYRVDLALKREDGSFAAVARSSLVHTPPAAPSSYADERWLPIRLEPRQPESATAARPPINLALEPPAGAPGESAGFSVGLPIDMREEVRRELAALYGERERGTLGRPLPSPSSLQLPIDMREEVRELLTQLHPGLQAEPPAPDGSPLFMQETPMGRVVRKGHDLFLVLKPGAIADLTERNERSFASGISSRVR